MSLIHSCQNLQLLLLSFHFQTFLLSSNSYLGSTNIIIHQENEPRSFYYYLRGEGVMDFTGPLFVWLLSLVSVQYSMLIQLCFVLLLGIEDNALLRTPSTSKFEVLKLGNLFRFRIFCYSVQLKYAGTAMYDSQKIPVDIFLAPSKLKKVYTHRGWVIFFTPNVWFSRFTEFLPLFTQNYNTVFLLGHLVFSSVVSRVTRSLSIRELHSTWYLYPRHISFARIEIEDSIWTWRGCI